MNEKLKKLRTRIVNGEIDINNTTLFFASATKAALYFLNDNISIRGKRVPHYIIGTGDDILYRESMNYKYSVQEVTDEDFVYNEIPRCIVTLNDIVTLPDQLTQPYTRSCFDVEYEGNIYEFSAETRRIPLQSTLSCKYYVDSFSDSLTLSQQLITKLCYVRTFLFEYMGCEVICSLKFPDSFNTEYPTEISFDSESKYKSISIELTLETNIPVFDNRTAVETSAIIRHTSCDISSGNNKISITDQEWNEKNNKPPKYDSIAEHNKSKA